MSLGDDGRHVLETGRADRSVWLMKCPTLVARSWQSSAAHSLSSSDPNIPNPVVAKVVLSLDPLNSDEANSIKFKMELSQKDGGNTPKSYSLNMFKDIVPMCVFSETNPGGMVFFSIFQLIGAIIAAYIIRWMK